LSLGGTRAAPPDASEALWATGWLGCERHDRRAMPQYFRAAVWSVESLGFARNESYQASRRKRTPRLPKGPPVKGAPATPLLFSSRSG